jgi:hypothetical protein
VLKVVLGLELDRWNGADLAVHSSVVEPVDVLGGGDSRSSMFFHGPVPDELGLEQ